MKYRLYTQGKATELAYTTEYEANYAAMIFGYFIGGSFTVVPESL